MPKKFKVEIKHTETYCIDVLAKNQAEAEKKALKKWNEQNKAGILHYSEMQDAEIKIETVYDVTHTDDPFNP